MRHFMLAFNVLLVYAFVAGAGASAQTRSATPQAPVAPAVKMAAASYSAVVTPTVATFDFPLRERAEWEWNRPETRDNVLEYRWTVEVEPKAGPQYEFGFLLFKFPDSRAARGPFADLLSAGQKNAAIATYPTRRRVVEDETVEVHARSGRLSVTLQEGETLSMLVRERPARARFRVNIPGEAPVERDVAIVYANR